MYTFWKRAAPPASMEIFNAPTRETCTMARERTNTPLQALVTLNDPQFVEAARNLAQHAIESSGDVDHRLEFHGRAAARAVRCGRKNLRSSAARSRSLNKHYTAQADDAKKLVAVGESKAEAKDSRRRNWPPGRWSPTS